MVDADSNYVNFYSPQCPPLTGKTVKQLRDYIQPFIKGIHDVSVTLGLDVNGSDGEPNSVPLPAV